MTLWVAYVTLPDDWVVSGLWTGRMGVELAVSSLEGLNKSQQAYIWTRGLPNSNATIYAAICYWYR